jgi:CheY-like chemotaxis protein
MALILMIDDDPDMVHIVTFRLEAHGHRVIEADSAQAAANAVLGGDRPDVVILDLLMPDLVMPDLTGRELLSRLRALDGLERLPAIFLSAQVLPDDGGVGPGLGATYLRKPFIASSLLKAIDDVLTPALLEE